MRRGGGLMIAPLPALDDAKPENVTAMFDVTEEYGVYNEPILLKKERRRHR